MHFTPVHITNAEHYTWGQGCGGWHLLRSAELSVIQEKMPPHTSEVMHYHAKARQFFFVLSGNLDIVLGANSVRLAAKHGLEIAPGTPHQVRNDADEDAVFLVISQPPSHADRHNPVP